LGLENVNATERSGLPLGSKREHGITEADLLEAAGGDLKAYMLAELNRAVDHAVEDRG
jgi:hypothetical protein